MYEFVRIIRGAVSTHTKSHQQQNGYRSQRNSFRCLPCFAPRDEKPNEWSDDRENSQSINQGVTRSPAADVKEMDDQR